MLQSINVFCQFNRKTISNLWTVMQNIHPVSICLPCSKFSRPKISSVQICFFGQISHFNGQMLTWKDRFLTISVSCSDCRLIIFSYASCNGHSRNKRFCTNLSSSTRLLLYDAVRVVWFYFAPFVGAAANRTFLKYRAKVMTPQSASVTLNVFIVLRRGEIKYCEML